jgi:hypothetical protein
MRCVALATIMDGPDALAGDDLGAAGGPKHFCNTMRQLWRVLSHQRDTLRRRLLTMMRSWAEACQQAMQARPRVHQQDADSSWLQA